MLVQSCIMDHSLLNFETYLFNVNLALRVIHVNHSSCLFLRSIDILLKICPHFARTLIETTTSCYLTQLCLLFILLELYWLFSNCKYLFVLHLILRIDSMDYCFDIVLYFCFWLLSHLVVFVIYWWWHDLLKLKLKRKSVVAWL